MKLKKDNMWVAVALALAFTIPTASRSEDGKKSAVTWTLASPTSNEIKNAKTAVTRNLKDPESARFEKIWVLKGTNGERSVCGYVNAKNSFGGYVGRKMFILLDQSSARFEDDTVFGMLFPSICEPRTVE